MHLRLKLPRQEKRLAQLAAKAEREALEAEETAGLTNKKAAAPKKMSQAQVSSLSDKRTSP